MQLEAINVSFRYNKKSPWILRHVNFSINEGEIIGLVAPSGYGKSTFAKLLGGYIKPIEGQILLEGKPLPQKGVSPIQLIYQHPEKAINPRWRMKQVLEESGMMRHDVMEAFGIEYDWLTRFPRELSGGELQRFCVARSLFEGTRFLIADEMSTMLDVITQAQIWNKMLFEVQTRNISLIVITHNRALAQRVCDKIFDMEKNTITELPSHL